VASAIPIQARIASDVSTANSGIGVVAGGNAFPDFQPGTIEHRHREDAGEPIQRAPIDRVRGPGRNAFARSRHRGPAGREKCVASTQRDLTAQWFRS